MVVYVQQFSLLGQADGKTKHRLEHQAGLSLLKAGLAREYQIIVSDMEKEITPGFKGKPFLHNNPEIFFNISHGGAMAACGLDRNPLGVDVEEIRPVKPAIWKRVLTGEERLYLERYSLKKQDREFFRIWTLKESYAKAIGLGLALDFTSLSCHLVSEEESARGDLKENVRQIPGKRFREGLDSSEEHFWMNEVSVERTQNEGDCPWHFFQTVLEERFVISCCCRLPFL